MSYQNQEVVYFPGNPTPLDVGFSEASIRKGFIRKVFAILSLQLLVTLGIIALFLYQEDVRIFSLTHPWMPLVALLCTFVVLILLACFDNLRRTPPWNYILLGLFTLFEGWMLGSFAASYSTKEVLLAIGIVTIVTIGLAIFATQTKWDFTTSGGILVVLLLVLIVFSLIAIIVRNNILNIVFAALAALLFGFYLVYDIQIMLGGQHKYSISPEEYIFAALNLYIDRPVLFVKKGYMSQRWTTDAGEHELAVDGSFCFVYGKPSSVNKTFFFQKVIFDAILFWFLGFLIVSLLQCVFLRLE